MLRCDAGAVSSEKGACALAAARELELGEPTSTEEGSEGEWPSSDRGVQLVTWDGDPHSVLAVLEHEARLLLSS